MSGRSGREENERPMREAIFPREVTPRLRGVSSFCIEVVHWQTIKFYDTERVQKVLVSANCPARDEKHINYYAGMSGAEIHKLSYPNDELGIICKKPFSISVLAFLKGAK